MTTLNKTENMHRNQSLAWKTGRFFLHLFEMLLAMQAGMGLFHLLQWLIPASSGIKAELKFGTNLHTILMAVFMTIPMAVWMKIRGHGWRYSVEMGVAMIAPMAAIILLCELGIDAYLPWLAQASGPTMYLGMLAYMLYRRDHFTGQAHHAAGIPH